MQTFILAGGCFWCLDAVYRKTRGVQAVLSGYTGGQAPDPDYYRVAAGVTGHAEAVAVSFDPEVIPAEVILDMFFTLHDPTTLNRQGYDVGTQYRSALFYRSEEEKHVFEQALARNQANWSDPIVTAITPAATFYPAEDVHQDYYAKYPSQGYCQVIINPKLAKARKYYSSWLVS